MQYIVIILFLAVSNSAFSASPDIDKIDSSTLLSIDKKHHVFSTHFYKKFLSLPKWSGSNFSTIKSLDVAVTEHYNNKRGIIAAALIVKYKDLVTDNYDNISIFNFIRVLLDQNEWDTAKYLFDLIKREGDSTLISYTSYLFSIFTFKRNQWDLTLKYLEGGINDLPDEDHHYALLMKGISLQKLTRHRESIQFYKKILPSSKYYISSRLNMAIAYIRQGWWTDAYIILENILKDPKTLKQEESVNRLYLTLGYSFLNQEYYRNSRDAFRNVGISSIYTNRALLGISLPASSQEDYIGALKSISILKKKNTFDLPVDESYLLMPYYYEKLQQPSTASAGYSEAINYYKRRISGIQSILKSDIDLSSHSFDTSFNTTIRIGKNTVNFSSNYPDYFIDNYLTLIKYKPYVDSINDKKLTTQFFALKSEYETVIKNMIRSMLNQRVTYLKSYIDQSRFGLARLYDNNLVTN